MTGVQSPGGFQYMAQNPSMIRAHRRGASLILFILSLVLILLNNDLLMWTILPSRLAP